MSTEKSLDELKPDFQGVFVVLRKNPQLVSAIAFFLGGGIALHADAAPMAGALFGAGATMLGGWVVSENARRAAQVDRKEREVNAKRFLAPELKRVIGKLLWIHQRAVANFSTHSADQPPLPDTMADFLPHMPVLYPNAPQFHDLAGDDAVSLVELYDSLHTLEKVVTEWYNRPDQLRVNVFNAILHGVERSLRYARTCVTRFDLDEKYPPRNPAMGTLFTRIETALSQSEQARQTHIDRFNAKP